MGRKTVEWMTQNHLNEKQLVSFDWEALKGYGYGNLMRCMIHTELSESIGLRANLDGTAGYAAM